MLEVRATGEVDTFEAVVVDVESQELRVVDYDVGQSVVGSRSQFEFWTWRKVERSEAVAGVWRIVEIKGNVLVIRMN